MWLLLLALSASLLVASSSSVVRKAGMQCYFNNSVGSPSSQSGRLSTADPAEIIGRSLWFEVIPGNSFQREPFRTVECELILSHWLCGTSQKTPAGRHPRNTSSRLHPLFNRKWREDDWKQAGKVGGAHTSSCEPWLLFTCAANAFNRAATPKVKLARGARLETKLISCQLFCCCHLAKLRH